MKEKNKGITLIALIITIIVMLILVSVTISMAINGGLFEKAGKAVGDTRNEINREQDLGNGKIQVDGKWYNSIEDYIAGIPMGQWYYCVSKTDATKIDVTAENKANLKFVTTGSKNSDGTVKIYEIGDTVEYTPTPVNEDKLTELNNLLFENSGYTDANTGKTANDYKTAYPLKQEITGENKLNWKIYDVKDRKLRIISDKPTTSKVYLYGARGYNNAVYLIDKVCKDLYSGAEGAEAQSLKIEDIEDKLTYKYTDYNKDSSGNVQYGHTPANEYTKFPTIHKDEDGNYKEIDLSTQNALITGTKEEMSTTKNFKPTQTYWYKSMEKVDFYNDKYYTLVINNGSNYPTFWLSSRAVYCDSSNAGFDVRLVYSGSVDAYDLFSSSGSASSYAWALRPLVSLPSDI